VNEVGAGSAGRPGCVPYTSQDRAIGRVRDCTDPAGAAFSRVVDQAGAVDHQVIRAGNTTLLPPSRDS